MSDPVNQLVWRNSECSVQNISSASGHLMASEHVFPLKEDVSHLELLQEICYIAVKVICMVSFSMNFGKYEYHTESERCMRSM
jgi:hypothetical protein